MHIGARRVFTWYVGLFIAFFKTSLALAIDELYKGDGLEDEADCVANAECQGEAVSMCCVRHQIGCQDDDMDEEDADDGAKEHLDEDLGRAVHGTGDEPVLQATDDAEVKRQQRHDR